MFSENPSRRRSWPRVVAISLAAFAAWVALSVLTFRDGEVQPLSVVSTAEEAVAEMAQYVTGWGTGLNVGVGTADCSGAPMSEALAAALRAAPGVVEVIDHGHERVAQHLALGAQAVAVEEGAQAPRARVGSQELRCVRPRPRPPAPQSAARAAPPQAGERNDGPPVSRGRINITALRAGARGSGRATPG